MLLVKALEDRPIFGDCLTTPAAIPAERCGYKGTFGDTLTRRLRLSWMECLQKTQRR